MAWQSWEMRSKFPLSMVRSSSEFQPVRLREKFSGYTIKGCQFWGVAAVAINMCALKSRCQSVFQKNIGVYLNSYVKKNEKTAEEELAEFVRAKQQKEAN